MFQVDPRFNRTVVGNLQNTSDFFKVTIPATSNDHPTVLVASVTATVNSTLKPSITVYDQAGNTVAVQVLINGSGAYLVQIPALFPRRPYTFQISQTNGTNGTYLLGVDFSPTQLSVTNLVDSTLQGSASQQNVHLERRRNPAHAFCFFRRAPMGPRSQRPAAYSSMTKTTTC